MDRQRNRRRRWTRACRLRHLRDKTAVAARRAVRQPAQPSITTEMMHAAALPETVLSIEHLRVRRQGKTVLQNINWRIRRGEQWAVLGPNGSGKTTLLGAIAGRLPTAAGGITFHPPGAEAATHSPKVFGIGFVSADQRRRLFERHALADEIRHFTGNVDQRCTALEYVTGRLVHDEHPAKQRMQRLEKYRDALNLAAVLTKDLDALTTGDISKLLILKALLDFEHPRMLMLDEPFNGLDPSARDRVTGFIHQLVKGGLQIILITHRLEEIIPDIGHVMLLTANGMQKKGPRKRILTPSVIRTVYPTAETVSKPQKPAQDNARPVHCTADVPNPHRNDHLVAMKAVTVAYKANVVLDRIDWTVRPRQNWMVCGPDGAGKTTLLKLITGENLQAYANDIRLFGRQKGSGESVWETRRHIGWVSSDLQARYPARINGLDVVSSGFFDSLGLYHRTNAGHRHVARRWLKHLDILHLERQQYGHLSNGQKQLLLIARAMVKDPILLLLDEPCDGLDFVNRPKVLQRIDYIGRGTPTAVVYATCDPNDMLPCFTHQLHLINRRAVTRCLNSPVGRSHRDPPSLKEKMLMLQGPAGKSSG